jgi:hypothetical protein
MRTRAIDAFNVSSSFSNCFSLDGKGVKLLRWFKLPDRKRERERFFSSYFLLHFHSVSRLMEKGLIRFAGLMTLSN